MMMQSNTMSISEDEKSSTPGATGRKRGRLLKVADEGTPKKRGRPYKNSVPEALSTSSDEGPQDKPVPVTPVITRSGRIIRTPTSYQASTSVRQVVKENSSTPTGRRRRKSCPEENHKETSKTSPSEEVDNSLRGLPECKRNKSTEQVTEAKVMCGVCKEEMLERKFSYHKYLVHQGLARLEGQSQEFTEQEKTFELKKTLERIRRVQCGSCSASFTSITGYQYHIKRCGKDPSELEDMLHECTVCGKKVVNLSVHSKIHQNQIELNNNNITTSEFTITTPDGKSKRAAAAKAVNLLRKLRDESIDVEPKGNTKEALKFLLEPSSQKISNSIISAWKRQITTSSVAKCRYPSCEFGSDNIDQLKEHHVNCEIGAKTQFFCCLKCPFRDAEKNTVLEHILKSHVTEAEFEPVDSSSSEEDETETDENEEEIDEEEDVGEGSQLRTKIQTFMQNPSKAYGISRAILSQFKRLDNCDIVPKWLAQYHKRHFTWDSSLFAPWKPKFPELLKSPKLYLPTLENSIPFARRGMKNSRSIPLDVTYEKLDLFQGILQGSTPVFFCGGPIESAAWCPMPLETSSETSGRDQYLAVSAFRQEHQYRGSMISPFASKYLIQIWNCGKLPSLKATAVIPQLAMGLAHEYGRVWCLKWCPSGCYDSQRLGILAAACSDGTIRCFAVPHPSSFTNIAGEPIFVKLEANVTLKLRTEDVSECTALSWDEAKGHRFIVGGFANGIVGCWDLQTKSPLLLKGDTLYPTWSFYAHSCAITAVTLSPHHGSARFVATASTDRSVKLWDRQDFRVPVCWSKRSRVTDLKWRRHWPGVIVCVDDFNQLFLSSSGFHDFGYTGNNRQRILPQNSVVWSTSENEFLDIVVHCTDAGEILVYPSPFAVLDYDEKKLRERRKIIFRTDLVELESQKKRNLMQSSFFRGKTLKSANKKVNSSPVVTETASKKYALIFNELPLNNSIKATSSCSLDVLLPNDEPHTSLRSIVFNPNFESHNWMCVCGENGLVHLLCLETCTLTKVADCYLNEIHRK